MPGFFAGRTLVVGCSPAFLRAMWDMFLVAGHDVTVLIEGESGTGKELFARAVHDLSSRRAGPFVAVNCAALPRELLESELFGYARGAFTGATQDQPGLVERAEGGTLFLDEIASMDLAIQGKLLRFLDSGELQRVGGREPRLADVRVVAACQEDLEGAVAAGRFRQDLYFRLAAYPLRLPALRDRREDLAPLVEHFVAEAAARLRVAPPRLAEAALARLERHAWPGNVRELQNVVTQLVLRHAGREVAPEQLPLGAAAAGATNGSGNGGGPLWRRGSFQELKSELVAGFEREYLEGLLRDHRGNVSRAARAAGKHRRALNELLRKHGLEAAEYRG